MNNRNLHIVSFDVPCPPDYGGVIDVFYKIKALNKKGVKIHLHCFHYGRELSSELNNFCETVNYYPRKMGKMLLANKLPFIVAGRKSEDLINNLIRENYPILFEGLHTCYHLNDERLIDRTKIVRMHNIEHDYYSGLATSESNLFKSNYFKMEAKKLKKFESVLSMASGVAAISIPDTQYLNGTYPNVKEVIAFHPHKNVSSIVGRGEYVLYHGNLTVPENNRAAMYLIKRIFSKLDIPLIIAGNRASKKLKLEASKNTNIRIRENLSNREMQDLIHDAQINVLPTFQSTGIKLKLLAALFMGRHCIVNTPMVENTGLESLCEIEDKEEQMRGKITSLFQKDFDIETIEKRRGVLNANFSNSLNVDRLLKLLY